jgi:superfamily II DNA/RNA helicase
MLSLVAYQGLRDMGIYNINDFFERHVLESTEDVVNYKEEIVQKDVVKSFNNRLLLQKLIYNHINYKTGEEAGVRRPCKINLPKVNEMKDGKLNKLPPEKQVLTYLRMTDRQRQNQNNILVYARNASAKGGQILKAMNFSLNNAFHPSLFDKIPPKDYREFVLESPKIHYTLECVRSVKQYHEKRGESVSGQVIYSNRGRDYFPYIKQYLEEETGYKKDVKWNKFKIDEVEIIDSSVTQAKKERIKEAFLDGACKIIIGTATIREGIDLQKKGTVIYNLYPDWNPTDIRQLEGRVWRQKNEYGYVRIVMPLVQDSMDVFIFQKLEEKTSRINDIWYRGDRGNVLDLESLDPEEVKFALLTDIEAIAASIIKKELKRQDRKVENIRNNIRTLNEFSSNYRSYEEYKRRLENAIKIKKDEIAGFNYILNKPSKEKLEKLDKENREKINKDIKLYDELVRFLETTPYEDKELLAMARKLQRRYDYFETFTVNNFREKLSIIRKAEKTILASKGYTLDDDIEKVIAEYKKDLEKESGTLKDLESEGHKKKVEGEVKKKKSAMRVTGKPIQDRVKEFASLNHLLSYKFSSIDPQICIIPTKELPPVKSQERGGREKRLRIARAKAEAKLKLLKLLEPEAV